MPYVVAALIVLGAVLALNLLLTFGVIRRLREHTKILEAAVPGSSITDFSATTVDGVTLTRDRLSGDSEALTVAFLAPECGSCRSLVPELAGWAARQDRERTLVVLDGQVSDPADLVAVLNPVAQVIVERSGTPVASAFKVDAFPSFCVVGEGRVLASFADMSGLRAALGA